jgi:hypothetical protein
MPRTVTTIEAGPYELFRIARAAHLIAWKPRIPPEAGEPLLICQPLINHQTTRRRLECDTKDSRQYWQ